MEKRVITIEKDDKKETFHVASLGDTEKIVQKVVASLKGGDVVALSGNLGAGKTTFVQMLGEELGIKEQITSPTFVLMKNYHLKKKMNDIDTLCHIDAYRLESARDLQAIGADEYIGNPTVLTCIEWPERVAALLPQEAIRINIIDS